ncbi:MAG: hypothetical protein ACRDZR_15795 [Acidimicrobiales bacterium]
MKSLARSFIAAFVSLATVMLVTAVGTTSALASTSASGTAWSSLQQSALKAASGSEGAGALSMVGTPGSVSYSTADTATGPVSLAQQTIVASNGTGQVVLVLAFLGGKQLIVNELSESTGGQSAVLVLRPGTSQIAGTYALPQPTVGATTAKTHGHANTVDDVLGGGHHHHAAHLDTTGGCYPAPYAPTVVTSTFGPLIDGLGVIRCISRETLSLIVSVYRGGTRVGTVAGGSGGGTWFGVNAYAPCNYNGSYHGFRTAQLWAVNGTLQGGATSATRTLQCVG